MRRRRPSRLAEGATLAYRNAAKEPEPGCIQHLEKATSIPLPQDPDRPPAAGPLVRLHLAAGRLLLNVVNTVRPRVTLGVRLLALDSEGRAFLVRHSYIPGYCLPGGAVDAGETCREAVVREAREEGGLVLASPPVLFGVYFNRELAERDHVVLFVSRAAEVGADRAAGLETVARGFFPLDRLPEGTTPATRARIDEALHGREPSEHW